MDIGTIPDNTGHTKQTRWPGQVSLQDNPQPNANIPHDVQDLGISWFTPEIVGFAEAPPSSLIPSTILNWFRQPKQNNNFPKGRFGIRTNDMQVFNSEPTTTYGFNLEYFEIIRPGDFPKIDIILRFKYNGDPAGIGVIRL
jgi:hypothetical protein